MYIRNMPTLDSRVTIEFARVGGSQLYTTYGGHQVHKEKRKCIKSLLNDVNIVGKAHLLCFDDHLMLTRKIIQSQHQFCNCLL